MADRRQLSGRVVEEFRANGGVVGGDFAGIPLLLLTTTGARTGQPRTWPLAYAADGDRLVVFAANGGRPTAPAWLHNLRAHPRATVEVGTETVEVTASVVEDGAERRRLWELGAAAAPVLAALQARTDRPFPVVVLRRL
jgi:deazaflavin-dependent oxidoreductase (nitroreductase family)